MPKWDILDTLWSKSPKQHVGSRLLAVSLSDIAINPTAQTCQTWYLTELDQIQDLIVLTKDYDLELFTCYLSITFFIWEIKKQ